MSTEHICNECGKSFKSASGLGAHKAFKHSDDHHEEYKDADTLREMYHDKSMSTYEIAEYFDVSASTIQKYMAEGGVKREKAYDDPTRPPSHLLDEHGDGVGNCYEKIRTHHKGERSVVLLHRLIAYAHGKIDFDELCDSDTVVHHKSGHGWDNRPDNLEVHSDQSEHMSHHLDERYGDGGWRDKDLLEELLSKTTQKEAAEILGCSKHTIYVWKSKHGLE